MTKMEAYEAQAKKYGLTVSTVRSRLRLNIPLDQPKFKNRGKNKQRKTGNETMRLCLCCGENFPSVWIGNRRCKKCEEMMK